MGSWMATIYLESSIPSYLAARPSRDPTTAANQQLTHEWWQTAPAEFEIFVSEAVVNEIARGNPAMAARRLNFVDGLPILPATDDVRALNRIYRKSLGLVGRARRDVPHFSFAVSYELDYLVTWNLAHIASPRVVRKLADLNEELGRHVPIVTTPAAFLADESERL